MVERICKLSTQKAKAEELFQVQDQPWLFSASLTKAT